MLTKIIEARMAEIIEAVDYRIQQSGYADKLGAGIVLTGGGAKLGELTEFVKYKTGMKVRKGEPLFVTSDSHADVQHGDYATVVGLLMKGATCKEPECVLVEPEPELFPVDNTIEVKRTKKPKRPENPDGRTPGIGTVLGRRIRRTRDGIVDGVQNLFGEFFTTPDNGA
jgi:cell division protein FtsA